MKLTVSITILGTAVLMAGCSARMAETAPVERQEMAEPTPSVDLSNCGTPADKLIITLPEPNPSRPNAPPARPTVNHKCMRFKKGESRQLKLQLRAEALLVFTDEYALENEEYVIEGPQNPNQPLDIRLNKDGADSIIAKYTVVDLRHKNRQPLDPVIVIDPQ